MNTYTFADVLIQPNYSEVLSRSNVDLTTDMGKFKLNLPIISANMRTITEYHMAVAMADSGGLGILHRFNSIEENTKQFEQTCVELIQKKPGVSIGVKEEDKDRFIRLYNAGARIFCIDVAHGHHILVKNMIKWIRTNYTNPDLTIIGGNIATGNAAQDLTDWGANIVKVGIGPGSVCQTRQQTGCGVPQLWALECIATDLDNMHYPTKIIADGGITSVGDIAKALKYADAVMLGSFISGTSETPGKVFKDPTGQFYKVYGGSASAENKGENKFVEGMMKTVPFRGKVEYILKEIKEGLQSAFSYVGANNLTEFQAKCNFIRLTGSGSKESKF